MYFRLKKVPLLTFELIDLKNYFGSKCPKVKHRGLHSLNL